MKLDPTELRCIGETAYKVCDKRDKCARFMQFTSEQFKLAYPYVWYACESVNRFVEHTTAEKQ